MGTLSIFVERFYIGHMPFNEYKSQSRIEPGRDLLQRSATLYVVAFVAAMLPVMAFEPSHASQKPRAVVALACDAPMRLCNTLVQVLAEVSPSHIYRINPCPAPSGALRLTFEIDERGHAHLSWPGGFIRAARQTNHSEVSFAREIIANAGSDLAKTLINFDISKP